MFFCAICRRIKIDLTFKYFKYKDCNLICCNECFKKQMKPFNELLSLPGSL